MRIGTLKTSYAADEALFDSSLQRALLVLLALGAIAFPFVASRGARTFRRGATGSRERLRRSGCGRHDR